MMERVNDRPLDVARDVEMILRRDGLFVMNVPHMVLAENVTDQSVRYVLKCESYVSGTARVAEYTVNQDCSYQRAVDEIVIFFRTVMTRALAAGFYKKLAAGTHIPASEWFKADGAVKEKEESLGTVTGIDWGGADIILEEWVKEFGGPIEQYSREKAAAEFARRQKEKASRRRHEDAERCGYLCGIDRSLTFPRKPLRDTEQKKISATVIRKPWDPR